MDILKDKVYENYNYLNRYTNVPYYFNTVDHRYIYGIGTQVRTDTASTLHQTEPDDTLAYLALKYYNNPTYWWAIAYFNNIQDAFVQLYQKYPTLRIPDIASLTFGAER